MDRVGVEQALLSVSTPGVHFGYDRAAAALARQCNEHCAGVSAREPRFGLGDPSLDPVMAEL